MKSELVLVSEPLAVSDLPLREKDFIECQRAVWGKQSALLYTVVAVCCIAVLGVYAIAVQMGINSSMQIGTVLLLLLCLLMASVFYFAVPKWSGKLLYLQYNASTNKPRSVAFYTDHFEIWGDGVVIRIYSYVSVRRIIKSENLFIMVLPNMVYLAVRCVGIPDERWLVIEEYIATIKNKCHENKE